MIGVAGGPAPEVLAKRGGRCRLCRKPIRSGEDYVAKVEPLGWLHAGCAAAYRRLREENAEADR